MIAFSDNRGLKIQKSVYILYRSVCLAAGNLIFRVPTFEFYLEIICAPLASSSFQDRTPGRNNVQLIAYRARQH